MGKCISLGALLLLLVISCHIQRNESNSSLSTENKNFNIDSIPVAGTYEIVKADNPQKVLVLFPCYPCDAQQTIYEFPIHETAIQKNISVIYLNFNKKLYLEEAEKKALATLLHSILVKEKQPLNTVYLGGFSSGGNMAMLLANFIIASYSELRIEGVFVVDSPLDLLALYNASQRAIERNFTPGAVDEGKTVVQQLEEVFGKPIPPYSTYEKYAPFIFQTKSIHNLKALKDKKIRLYSEPDTAWWKANRGADYQDTNAYYLEQLSKILKDKKFKKVEYFTTHQLGYRANGQRHPHAWSIVEPKALVDWILK